jgi:hypothetical protein
MTPSNPAGLLRRPKIRRAAASVFCWIVCVAKVIGKPVQDFTMNAAEEMRAGP